MSDLQRGGGMRRGLIFLLCLGWFVVTMFPIYWTLITSFKPPTAVSGGPTYLPWIDFEPTLQAWIDALSGVRGNFITPFVNSTLIGLAATALSVALGSMAAYALVRFPFQVRLLAGVAFAVVAIGGFLLLQNIVGLTRVQALGGALVVALAVSIALNALRLPGPVLGNDDVVFWFVSQRMFPPIVTAFALYLLYSEIGKAGLPLLDSFWGMTLCYTAFSLPIVVWLMRDFFQALPVEIEEAALVDDVPRFRIFLEIVLPMARPGLIATSMITLSFVWNEFLFSLLLTAGSWQTLPIMLSGQNSYRGDEWWAISVAAMISIGPMMVMAILLARLMRSGLLLGSIR
ncbi:carbohydrate ABC transporter permease [Inquilinus sp.]|jgi:multiple sugar transport system permease protein|uniref:carbohydrate ABC transporter permease n=1 Tax=Inquilinus sp. TaxID=1932117 RepID=UPI003784708C